MAIATGAATAVLRLLPSLPSSTAGRLSMPMPVTALSWIVTRGCFDSLQGGRCRRRGNISAAPALAAGRLLMPTPATAPCAGQAATRRPPSRPPAPLVPWGHTLPAGAPRTAATVSQVRSATIPVLGRFVLGGKQLLCRPGCACEAVARGCICRLVGPGVLPVEQS